MTYAHIGPRTTIIFEIDFCYLYRAMSHFTRELKGLTTALKIELRKGMSRYPNALNTICLFHPIEQLSYTIYLSRLAIR